MRNNFLSIIIPTLNEKDNIPSLIKELEQTVEKLPILTEIIFVDDGSTDGTIDILRSISSKNKCINLIIRNSKYGLGSAIMDGIKVAKGDLICVMDADLSHPPSAIFSMLKAIMVDDVDMVVGSRYLGESQIKNWSFFRRLLSKIGTIFASLITDIRDPLSGFFMIRRDVIENCNINFQWFKICLEIISKAKFRGKIVEVPYTFTDRKAGKSKMNLKIVLLSFYQILSLILSGKNSNFKKFIKFCLIGSIGLIINLTIFYILVNYFNWWYMSSALISFIFAVTSNYFLNRYWNFKSANIKIIPSYFKFILFSLLGLCINIIFLYLFVEFFRIPTLMAQFLAILCASLWNFINSKKFVFED
ncbi:MAG: glycosyltransferase family 2 protein [Patescibacteria group bacterium]|nr:glycosyltransferase family 2 protein [Patescibacteria group bacterium]